MNVCSKSKEYHNDDDNAAAAAADDDADDDDDESENKNKAIKPWYYWYKEYCNGALYCMLEVFIL